MKQIPLPGAHGGDGPAIASALGWDIDDVLDLSQTLNPFAPDVASLVARHAAAVRHYPDPSEATALLAATIGVDAGRLLLANGGSEAITIAAAEVGGTVASEPEFSLHPRGAGPIWHSDPHNPTGRLAGPNDTADVWDEAFFPLATGRWHAHRPGITVGSLTKLFACPGLRLGYLIADDIDRFARHQPAWSVSSVALAALPELLAKADLPAWAESIAAARTALVNLLRSEGFNPIAADAPWVLVDAPGLRKRLATHGVAVRDCSSFEMPGVHRIAVTDEQGLDRLAGALEAVRRAA